MIAAVRTYCEDLIASTGASWDTFWYSPRGNRHLNWLTRIVAALALIWVLSFTGDLTAMLGESGWLSTEVVHQTTTDGDPSEPAPGLSPFFISSSSAVLWAVHAITLLVLGCVLIGFRAPITTPLALLLVLGYVHRAPMVTTVFETVMCMLLLYLTIAAFSSGRDWISNVATRLIQLHLCGIYLLIAASKLGTAAWWTGDATWYLFTDTQHRLGELDGLTQSTYLLNAVAHAWVYFELAFPVLIWNKKLRPLLITISILFWTLTAITTGQIAYAGIMFAANLAFMSDQFEN